MGFFNRTKETNSDNSFCERFKTADFDSEENEDLVEYLKKWCDLANKNSIFPDLYQEPYQCFRNFLINISSEETADLFLPPLKKKFAVNNMEHAGRALALKNFAQLLAAWGIEDAIKENNAFRTAINNKSFKNILNVEVFLLEKPISSFYNAYIDGHWGIEAAKDENSIIFNKDLWQYSDNEVKRYIELDKFMKDSPNERKSILYKEDGSLRSLKYIEKDLEDMLIEVPFSE